MATTHQHAHATAEVVDPVCDMTISPADAVGHVEHKGRTYYFCSEDRDDRKRRSELAPGTLPPSPAEFVFVARNPRSEQVAWKAPQRFADGTSADWVGVEGDRRPAAVTRLTAGR